MAWAAWLMAIAAPAGEARLGYREIAWFVQSQLNDLVVMCGRSTEAAPGCDAPGKITLGRQKRDQFNSGFMLAIDAPQFSSLGGRYELRPLQPFSLRLDATAAAAGLELTVDGRESIHFAVACLSGTCMDMVNLPRIVWRSPHVVVRLGSEGTSEHAGEVRGEPPAAVTRPLKVLGILIGGRFELECSQGWGLAAALCAMTRAAIGPDVSGQVRAAGEAMRARINTRGIAATIALGQGAMGTNDGARDGAGGVWHALRVREIVGDANGVRISFCFRLECA